MERGAWFLLLPIFVVTLWHAYLISGHIPNKPNTISEHALLTPEGLWIHRILHILTSLSLLIYAVLNKELYGWTVWFLIAGAIFDVLEVLTLNQNISKSPMNLRDRHQLTSWLMAESYLTFVITAGMYRGLSGMVTTGFLAVYIYLFILASYFRFKRFLGIQMAYFVVLAINMTVLSLFV